MAKSTNLLGNKDTVEKALKAASEYFEEFKSQREEFEDIWELADYMVKCAQNRTLNSTEKAKGVNPAWSSSDDDESAQTGSTIFFRQHRQLAAQGVSVQMSQDVPFKFTPVINEGVWASPEDADEQAHQLNCLAKWNLKRDNFNLKAIKFWHQLKKYGNIPVLFYQRQKWATVRWQEPVIEMVPIQTAEGVVVQPVETGVQDKQEDRIVDNYFSMDVLTIDGLYADVFIPTLQGQDCVILPSLYSKADMLQRVRSGDWDEAAVKEITSRDKWDGTTAAPLKESRRDNLGQGTPDQVTDRWLVWDVFMRCPIENGQWDVENFASDLYRIAAVGNDLKNAKTVSFERNADPDDEIPVYMIHDLPDDEDILYHVAAAQIIRSNYSVECTLKNQAIDNNSEVNHPPLVEVEGAVRGHDRKFGPNTRWIVDTVDAIKEFQVRPLGAENIQLLQFIQEDTKNALSTVSNILGESYGGRTSALEAGNAYRNSVQPHMITVKYVLEQLLPVYARKFWSYWKAFAAPGQIVAITDDQNRLVSVNPSQLHGEFDVVVDIVDEFENDVVQNQRLFEAMNIIGGNPEIAKHVDLVELLGQWMKKAKLDYTKIVKRPTDYDARQVAQAENMGMMQGTPATVKEGENLNIHLMEHNGERIRYNGLEDMYPNVQLLDQHIAETKEALKGQSAGSASGSPTAPNMSQGAGEMEGNQIAAALGAVGGGGA